MAIFRLPELAARVGALHDEAFVDGAPASAHVLRELARGANRLLARGGLVYRGVFSANLATETEGAAISFAPPYWQALTPTPAIEVDKKFGITSLRVRLRLVIDNGFAVALFVGTSLRPSPSVSPLATWNVVTGTGAEQVVDLVVPAREAAFEQLSFFYRAIPGAADPLLATGTYGGPATGVVDSATEFQFTHSAATWNTIGASQIHLGGHYVVFSDATGTTPVHGPCEVRAVLSSISLAFYPPAPNVQLLRGSTFTIRKLPAVRLISCAVYGVDRSP